MKAGWYYKHGTSTHFFKKEVAVSVCGMMKREGATREIWRDNYRQTGCFYDNDCARCWAKREGRK